MRSYTPTNILITALVEYTETTTLSDNPAIDKQTTLSMRISTLDEEEAVRQFREFFREMKHDI